jgi:hypothetical protein
VATLFAFASYLGTLVVLGIICFGLGRYNPKYGVDGSFVVMAVIFAIFLPVAALGFYLGKRGSGHTPRIVALAGLVSGAAASLLVFLCDWIFASQLGTFLLPLCGIFLAGFISARLTEPGRARES